MRVDSALVSQSLIESQKPIEKKEVSDLKSRVGEYMDDAQSFVPSPFGAGATYSISSLRSAVDYHAKFLTVAANNTEAVNHAARIPQFILDRLKGQ